VVIHVSGVNIREFFFAQPALDTHPAILCRRVARAEKIPYRGLFLAALRSRTKLLAVIVKDDDGIISLPMDRL
jgi:hypothetical protein